MPDLPTAVEDILIADWHRCHQLALALEAASIPHAIQQRPGGFAIIVAARNALRARSELKEYEEEYTAPEVGDARDAVAPHGNGWVGSAGFAITLAAITALQHNHVFAPDWHDAGKLNAALVRAGEVWRTATALTLHEDFAHLLSNIAIGGLIGLFVGQLLGSGLAWMSILIAGAAGNLLSASFRPDGYTAIGASTAVFAALGILAGCEGFHRRSSQGSALVRYAPIVGGVVLLSYLGTGGERTDVISHVLGFVCGLLLGGVYGKLGTRLEIGRIGQLWCGITALGLLAISWIFALK